MKRKKIRKNGEKSRKRRPAKEGPFRGRSPSFHEIIKEGNGKRGSEEERKPNLQRIRKKISRGMEPR